MCFCAQVLQSEMKELRERTRDLESRQRRLTTERDTARGRAEQLERQLASCACRGRSNSPARWVEKNSDEDSGKHSDNSLSQSEPGWLDTRYKVQQTARCSPTERPFHLLPSPASSSPTTLLLLLYVILHCSLFTNYPASPTVCYTPLLTLCPSLASHSLTCLLFAQSPVSSYSTPLLPRSSLPCFLLVHFPASS